MNTETTEDTVEECEEIYSKADDEKTAKQVTTEKTSNANNNSVSNYGEFKITHYCPCDICNPNNAGKTATGNPMIVGRTVAVDPSVIPLGSKVIINGQVYYAEDTGVKGKKIDVLVSSHSEAYQKGVYYTDVQISK